MSLCVIRCIATTVRYLCNVSSPRNRDEVTHCEEMQSTVTRLSAMYVSGVVLFSNFIVIFSYFQQFRTVSMSKTPTFPRKLKEFGYDFDKGGKLRKIDPTTGLTTDQGFEFNVSDDALYNQKRYEALGEVMNEYVYELLEKEGLKRIPVPKISDVPPEQRSFVFASEDAFTNKKLLILIHGSGVVRAGQWARRLIINDSLNSGTQIPYVRRAKGLGYGVLVLNTNDNQRSGNAIVGSEDPHEHVSTVWTDYVHPSSAERVAIVAHSYGGVCAIKFGIDHSEEFKKRVFAVAFTDSVHIMQTKGREHIVQVARNWVSSEKPLDTPEPTTTGDVECVSAGHAVHEMTSWSCIDSLFKFLEDRYKQVTERKEL